MRSIENIPQHKKVFFENVLTIFVLVLELKALRIPALGLVASDRIVGAVIKSKKAMLKGEKRFHEKASLQVLRRSGSLLT